MGGCLTTTRSSSFAQGKEGPCALEEGNLVCLFYLFMMIKDLFSFFFFGVINDQRLTSLIFK